MFTYEAIEEDDSREEPHAPRRTTPDRGQSGATDGLSRIHAIGVRI